MRQLAARWDDPALEAVLNRASRLRDRPAAEVVEKANTVLDDLDDLAVLVLFSVFEATVRTLAKADVNRETAQVRHPAVLRTVNDLKEAIENGSFGKVTDAYKTMGVDLTAQVNQVRKFRNWVAHGRRDVPENRVEPQSAIDRLRRYLERLAELESTQTLSMGSGLPQTQTEPEPELSPGAAQPSPGSP